MEPKGSLPHSQVPAAFLYPEPGQGQVKEQLSAIFNFCTSLTFNFVKITIKFYLVKNEAQSTQC
jgi:hypothetical protein